MTEAQEKQAGRVISRWRLLLSVQMILFCLPLAAQVPSTDGQNQFSHIMSLDWHKVQAASGVTISTGEWPGSDFTAFRTETVYKASRRDLLDLITNVNAYREWMTDCDESRLLEKTSEHHLVYYVAMNSPWPLSDRDWVNSLQMTEDTATGEILVIYRSVAGYMAEKPGVIRIRRHFAVWQLKPIGEGRFSSVWYAHSDPGGWIPGWLVKLTYDSRILQTTLNMQQWMDRKKAQ